MNSFEQIWAVKSYLKCYQGFSGQLRNIPDAEIIERCMFSLVNEGLKILEEGIAIRPDDVDAVYVYGYGFPRYRGGPM